MRVGTKYMRVTIKKLDFLKKVLQYDASNICVYLYLTFPKLNHLFVRLVQITFMQYLRN